MVEPITAIEGVHVVGGVLLSLISVLRKFYKIDSEVESVLNELDIYQKGFAAIGNKLKKDPSLADMTNDIYQRLKKAAEAGSEIAKNLRPPTPAGLLTINKTTPSAQPSTTNPLRLSSEALDCFPFPAATQEKVLIRRARMVVTNCPRRLGYWIVLQFHKAKFIFSGAEDIKNLLKELKESMDVLLWVIEIKSLFPGNGSLLLSIDLTNLPFLQYVFRARDRARRRTQIRQITWDVAGGKIISYDGYDVPYQDEGDVKRIETKLSQEGRGSGKVPSHHSRDGRSRRILDRERKADISKDEQSLARVKEASETFVRMFQLDEDEDPEEFRKATGLLSCSALIDGGETRSIWFNLPKVTEGGLSTLRRRLQEGPEPSLANRIHFACDLAHSMSAMHAMGIVHRAMFPNNILLVKRIGKEEGYESQIGRPYIIGFDCQRGVEEASGNTDFANDSLLRTVYRHPRLTVKGRSKYEMLDDIYSFGVILIEIITWRPFFKVIHNETNQRSWMLDTDVPQLNAREDSSLEKALIQKAKELEKICPALAGIALLCLQCWYQYTDRPNAGTVVSDTDADNSFPLSEESALSIVVLRMVVEKLTALQKVMSRFETISF